MQYLEKLKENMKKDQTVLVYLIDIILRSQERHIIFMILKQMKFNLDRYMNELNEADKISRNEESVDPIVEMFA